MLKILSLLIILSSQLFCQWEIITTNQKRELDEVFFVDSLKGWMVGEKGTILFSKDGGKSWTEQVTDTKADLQTLFFMDNYTGWVAGKKGTILKTTNSGNTWQKIKLEEKASIKSVVFINNKNGWICSKKPSAIYSTIDGGNTWSTQFNDEQIKGLARLQFSDNTHGWCVGDDGTLLKTENGKDWTYMQIETTKDLSALHFVDNNTGFVGGKGGNIFNTTDAGKTWQRQSTYTVDEIEAIIFVNSEVGWAGGDEGQILFTLNGGKKWIMQKTPITHDLKHLFFLDENFGWGCGVSPLVIKTKNGGGIRPELAKQNSDDTETEIVLNQNYPNPFNPDTKISFSIPEKSEVTLKIFDIVGNEIAVLLNKTLDKGKYTVNFSAYELLSGIYLYTLQAGDVKITKKMTLIK